MADIYILIGPPGSGKGTQAQLICDKLNIDHFDMGSTLRAYIAKGGELSDRISSFTNKGELVPIEIIKEVIANYFQSIASTAVLDGFPRSIEQAHVLDAVITEGKHNLKAIIFFDVDKAILKSRIINRRVNPVNGDVFNLVSNMPDNLAEYEKLNGRLIQRADDTEEVFENRFKVYLHQTQPIIEYYRNKPGIITVNGAESIENIQIELSKIFGQTTK